MKPFENKNMDKTIDTLAIIGNGLIAFVAFILAYTGLPSEAVIVFVLLMVVDYIAGLWSAWVVGTPITSRHMKVGMMAKAITLIIPFTLAAILKVTMPTESRFVADFALSVFIMAEGYSILSNGSAIKTGKYLPEFEVIALLGSKLRILINKKLDIDEK